MEKRNTLIFTIIAIVTLLITLIGATYAYFTFTATISSGTNTITSTTGSIGNVTLVATIPSLYISTTSNDFKEGTTGTFWSSTNQGTYDNSETKRTINTLKATGGSESTIYECTYNLNVTTTGLPASGMTTGEYVVYIAGVENKTLDMSDTSNRNKTYTVTRYLTGTTAKTLTSSAKLVNRNGIQNYLQNLNAITTFTTSNLNCEVVASAGTDTMTEAQAPTAYFQYSSTGLHGVSAPLNSNSGLDYYIKGSTTSEGITALNTYQKCDAPTSGNGKMYCYPANFDDANYDWDNYPDGLVNTGINYTTEVCGVFNGTEVCVTPNTWSEASTYKSNFEAAGAECNSTYSSDGYLECSLGSVGCGMNGNGVVLCGSGSSDCGIYDGGRIGCFGNE